jgi:hypothetical protein
MPEFSSTINEELSAPRIERAAYAGASKEDANKSAETSMMGV